MGNSVKPFQVGDKVKHTFDGARGEVIEVSTMITVLWEVAVYCKVDYHLDGKWSKSEEKPRVVHLTKLEQIMS